MTQTPNTEQLRRTVQASLFAALIAAGAFLAVPIGPVPIVLQNMFVLLAGLLLGPRWGLAGVGIYLLAGAIGLPVFAGGTGGIGRMLGPTGGVSPGLSAGGLDRRHREPEGRGPGDGRRRRHEPGNPRHLRHGRTLSQGRDRDVLVQGRGGGNAAVSHRRRPQDRGRRPHRPNPPTDDGRQARIPSG